jgi:hypothetical protein
MHFARLIAALASNVCVQRKHPSEEARRNESAMSRRGKDRTPSTSGARGGRPRLEDADRRDRRIGVPVNQHEEDAIDDKAKLAHMRKSVFLRHLGLGKHIHRPVPAINYRAYRQLGRLAANFSYALTLLDAGKRIGIDRQLVLEVLDEIRHLENLLMKGE